MNTQWLLLNAMAAAIYAALTLGLAPLSYGPIQVRISEFMTLLAFYNPKYIPGLVLGCLLANLGSPFGAVDMVVGTLATFLAVQSMRYCSNVWLASFMPVIFNAVLIGLELAYLAEVPFDLSLLGVMLYIGAGELIAVTFLGNGLFYFLRRNEIIAQYLRLR